MNFFEQQAQARRLSRRLVALFVAAVVAIVMAIDTVVYLLLNMAEARRNQFLVAHAPVASHGGAIVVTSLVVLAVIAIASMYKTSVLSAGGSAVAKSVGGERVPANTTDPLRKRLLNVVEEMAIASGVPVPEVFVLEHETGINAFAAGYTPANAAIAVTRGALETLNRNELQAVIAHEFSHVLNGDMRLNTRLIGLLFGILMIALAGRFVLRMAPRSDSRKGGIAAVIAAAFAVMVIGYIGLFFGRLIQAAVARSRERLADSSAVQFTRDPMGLRGALVKIGAIESGSAIRDTDVESVAHLLFAPGAQRWFATHPPLETRIRAIDPSFRPEEFASVRAALAARANTAAPDSESSQQSSRDRLETLVRKTIAVTPAMANQMFASPRAEQIAIAATIRKSLPVEVLQAGHDVGQARAMLLAMALDDDATIEAQQLKVIETQLGKPVASSCASFRPLMRTFDVVLRQPALLHLLPTLRQLSADEKTQLLICLNALLQRAGQVTVEKYALRKLAQVYLRDGMVNPPVVGRGTLQGSVSEIGLLLGVLAAAGHESPAVAREAYEAGMQSLFPRARPEFASSGHWQVPLDSALGKLDRLLPAAKELLIQAMLTTITHDGMLAVREAELLRAFCATLHCPLPPLVGEPDSALSASA